VSIFLSTGYLNDYHITVRVYDEQALDDLDNRTVNDYLEAVDHDNDRAVNHDDHDGTSRRWLDRHHRS
jgi:hypothetical protein